MPFIEFLGLVSLTVCLYIAVVVLSSIYTYFYGRAKDITYHELTDNYTVKCPYCCSIVPGMRRGATQKCHVCETELTLTGDGKRVYIAR